MATYPKYGADTGFIKTTKSDRAEQAELQRGRHADVLVKSTTGECAATKSDCSWGIEPDADGTIFDSIRISVEDELDPKYTANQSGTIDPTLPLVAVLNGCCLVKRAKTTLTISGKGDPGWTLGSTTTPSSMKAAIGTAEVKVPTGDTLRLQSYSITNSDTDWQTFNAEYVGYTDGNTDGKSVVQTTYTSLPTVPNCTCGDNDCCNVYKYEQTLNGTGYAELTLTKTSHPFAPAA
jgi:hypothetical protein